jgi:hypothetical protein
VFPALASPHGEDGGVDRCDGQDQRQEEIGHDRSVGGARSG